MTSTRKCCNCSHQSVCVFMERLKEALKDFPFKDDGSDDEYEVPYEISDVQGLANYCDRYQEGG